MTNERKTEIKVGITTIVSLAVFIWIMAWAKNFLVTTSDKEITIYFENVSGLEVDDDVTVRGLRTGFVQDILLDRNIILVKISVDSHLDLRKDAEFWLATVDLMGDKKIEIYPGDDNEKLNMDIIHSGQFQPDLSTMMETIGAMRTDLFTIVDDIKISLRAINSYLTDDQIKNDFKSSLSNINKLTTKIDQMIDENRENFAQITENTSVLTADARMFFDQNQENLTNSITTLSTVLAKSDTLVTSFNQLVVETKAGKNNLGKILYDDSLMVSMKESIDRLRSLTKVLLYQLDNDGIKIDASIF